MIRKIHRDTPRLIQRLVYHQKFFITAFFCLLLSFPGTSAALFNFTALGLTSTQRVETFLLHISAALLYTLVLALALSKILKWLLAFGFTFIPLLITILKDGNFELGLRPEAFAHYLPGLLAFVFLTFAEDKRNSRATPWVLASLALCILFGTWKDTESAKFLDKLRLHDIHDRLASGEAMIESLQENCNSISERSIRHQCDLLIAEAIKYSTNCEIGDSEEDLTDCAISRRQYLKQNVSGHPRP